MNHLRAIFFSGLVCLPYCFGVPTAAAQTAKAPKRQTNPAKIYPPKLSGARAEIYRTVGDTELKLWIFEPPESTTSAKRPAIVFFFGGGWKSGSPAQFKDQCRYLASRGMVAITADYRVSTRHGTKAIDCVKDAKAAVRYIRKHASRLMIDPDKIVAGGGSAGGHLAACTGTISGFEDGADTDISSVPNAMALFNPAVTLLAVEGAGELRPGAAETMAERVGGNPEQISPYHHVRKNQPPTIIFHGEADVTVPFWTVDVFTKRMQDNGNRCELVGFPGAGHGFFNSGRGNNPRKTRTESAILFAHHGGTGSVSDFTKLHRR